MISFAQGVEDKFEQNHKKCEDIRAQRRKALRPESSLLRKQIGGFYVKNDWEFIAAIFTMPI
jgi:hypothetical protein